MYDWFAYMYVCALCPRRSEEGARSLELEFQMVLSQPVDAGNWGALEKHPTLLI